MSKKVFTDVDMKLNEVENMRIVNYDADTNPFPAADMSGEGQLGYDKVKKGLKLFDGQNWVEIGGTQGALNPIGTLGPEGSSADYKFLPANAAKGDAYFVAAEGTFEKKHALPGDFFFRRNLKASEIGSGYKAIPLSVLADEADEDKVVFVKNDTADADAELKVDASNNYYFTEKAVAITTVRLWNKDLSAYVAPDTGAKFVLEKDETDPENVKYYVSYDADGTETSFTRLIKNTAFDDLTYPSWALVPAGNGYIDMLLEGEDSGISSFPIENVMKTTKCTVTVMAAEDNSGEASGDPAGDPGFAIDEGEVVVTDVKVKADFITVTFGHALYNPTKKGQKESDKYADHTKYTARIAFC